LPADVPAVVYVHEGRDALAALTERSRRGLLERATIVFAVSQTVHEDLVALGVDPARLRLARPTVRTRRPSSTEVDAARRELGAAPGEPLVIGCGEATWRKGADLFLDVAARLAGPVHVAWVGRRSRSFGRLLDGDASTLRLHDRLTWTGEVADPSAHLAAADVLLMTSREDPQPLVPLEAASVGTPTVAFDVGGLGELVGAGGAIGVTYPDTAAAAASVDRMLRDRAARDVVVDVGRRLAAERSPEVLVPRMLDLIRPILGDAHHEGAIRGAT
jgi:glycosyltransferase involved in cell wall biosynthesis